MTTPLLTTKLYIPPVRPELVSRPHLIEQLNAGLDRKLTLISAPAGFGKTTLLSEWVGGCQRPVAWLSLDESDSDPARFFTYFIAALQRVDPGIGQGAQAMMQSPQPPPPEALLTTLINEIAAVSQPFILVFDDYHLINAPPIHQQLAFLLEHQPPQMHLVIATREDPPLPLSRLRARGQTGEIRQADLRFTPEETADFLRRVTQTDLSCADVAALQQRTEGWIAGLQLVALSIRGHDDVSRLVQSFTGSHRYILDYLMDEVFHQQPEETRTFLLQTSILNRLSGPLCNAVTGQENGQDILEHLESANLFVIPLDDERHWYRYHHLFGDLLRHYLKQEVGSQGLTSLHRRACAWLVQHDLKAEALHHAIAGEDFDRAADLIEAIAEAMVLRGAVKTVQSWIDALPHDLVRNRPLLSVIHAWAFHTNGQREAVEPHLRDAERGLQALGLPDDDPFVSDLRGHIAAMRASNARHRKDLPLFFRYAEEALGLLAEDDLIVRTTVSANLGLAHMLRGDLMAAVKALWEAQSLGQASGNVISAVNCVGFQTAVLIAQGQLRQAAELCRHTIDHHLDHYPKPLPTLGHVHANLARVLYEWNDLEAAAAHLEQSVVLGEQTHLPSTVRFRASLLAWIRQIQGADGDAAPLPQQVAAIADRERCPEPVEGQTDLNDVDFTAWRVRLWLAQNNVAVAAAWAEAYRAGEVQPQIWHPYGDLALARVLIAQQRLEDALDMLAQISQSAQEAGGTGWVIEARILEALAFQTMSETDRALTALSQGLSLAEPESYVRTFVDGGEPMAALLRQAGLRGIAPHYVGQLLAAFGPSTRLRTGTGEPESKPLEAALRQAQDAAAQEAMPILAFHEALTERELEILRLIDAGLSNREIAEALYISLNTIKTHTKSLYSKLNVHSRTQAINRARDLKLL
jgi:LuxR family maltose regulon positive regulatory protein